MEKFRVHGLVVFLAFWDLRLARNSSGNRRARPCE